MLSRALGVATALLVMSLATVPAQAQNLDSGKAPSQIFAGSCAACHKSPRGLLKTVAPGSLPGFLRQHYTTGPDMASMLSAYVISNGAADPRGGGLTRQGQDLVAPRRPADARPGAAPAAVAPQPEESTGFFGFGRKPAEPPQEAAKPVEPPMTPRQKRAADRAAKRAADRAAPAAAPAVAPGPPRPAVLGEPPVPVETAPARPSRQKAAKKGRRGQEETKPAAAEPAKPEQKEEARPIARPAEEAKPEAVKPEPRHEPAHSEPRPERRPEPAEVAPLRADPVPPVTPAPRAEPEPRPAAEPSTPAPASPAPSAATPTPSPAAPPAAE